MEIGVYIPRYTREKLKLQNILPHATFNRIVPKAFISIFLFKTDFILFSSKAVVDIFFFSCCLELANSQEERGVLIN